MPAAVTDPVDEVLPVSRLILLGLQHVLVMAASPITAVFLVGRALHLSSDLTVNLISATFLMCGLGSLLQSIGPFRFGARLPFIMVPGGAPIVIFLTIAQQTDIQTASGAVILTALFYFVFLPVFARCVIYFPRLVIGTMLLLVAINLVKVYGGIITGTPGSPDFAAPKGVLLALCTVGFTLIFARLFTGIAGQLSVLFGLLIGTIAAALTGNMSVDGILSGPVIALPQPFPFGVPHFDIVSAVPLIVFSIISMAEATGQTVAIADVVGKEIVPRDDVPKTIRGDALISLLGGCFGTSLIITSGENIGIVRATGVRSRYVTATSGIILLVIALLAPLGRLVNAIPGAVVGGTAIIVFCIIAVMGIDMLRKVDLREHGNLFTLAAALAVGLLPILVPGIYSKFPAGVQMILGNGLAAGTVVAVLLNILFHHVRPKFAFGHAEPAGELADPIAPDTQAAAE
ncbi:uracil-xanthine permease family protein [Bradyrhizobium cytisi]|uniref:Uracil-xanthine permease n=1 Tax=Bradyrhizobium cytisi TaxID=515489 RepID=A0A5S4W5L4_9BRAD|nr:solute carrier family 23 protein [Bradyrhizobium cytisi]TYL76983.1 uracil-xanthine permease [Bradyrhizobium cytisi]